MDDDNINTYEYDDQLPSLPLPDLNDTLQRYYESLKPFGNADELMNSQIVITKFQKGIGAELQAILKERANNKRNWLEEWWEAYGYHILRMPLIPYVIMVMPLKLQFINIPETREYTLKNTARIMYHIFEFWNLLHKGKLKPLSTHNGQIKYSSAQYKRIFSTTRVPGVEMDHINQHFKTVYEGNTPSHFLISGKGRLFVCDCLLADRSTLIQCEDIFVFLQKIRNTLDYEPIGDCVPILTHDNRTDWAFNRQRLMELSPHNKFTLNLIESANILVVLDEHEPNDYTEISQLAIAGDFHSLWADKSSTMIVFKNGKFAFLGEHSSYDATISISLVTFLQQRLIEIGEPDWSKNQHLLPVKELFFNLNDKIKLEIEKIKHICENRRNDITVTHEVFEDYGKDFIKSCKLNPDSYVQILLQLAYNELHNEIGSIYETALMRHYYNGRTETLRSCNSQVQQFIQACREPNLSNIILLDLFRKTIQHHNHMMKEARQGSGIDRHLFGLWCAVYENKIKLPDLFKDPLYSKSGGGGNFVLSTSTLGDTINVGFVLPMILDGYGVFYSITSKSILVQVTAFRKSEKSNALKLNEHLFNVFRRMKYLIDEYGKAKL